MVAKNFNYDADFGGNEIQNVVLQNLSTTPSTNLKGGRFWYDTANNKPMYYNGSAAKEFGKEYTEGTGINISGTTISVDTDVIAQQSDIPTDYVPNTRKVNDKALSSDITLGASDVGAVPTTRKVNNKALSADITLTASDVGALASTLKGAASGVAELDSSGKVPSSQLPSFVDDVIDAYIVSGATALSAGWLSATDGGSALTPETGKIYVVLSTGSYQNKTYRYSGSTYVEISASPGAASESSAGIIEIATTSEVSTGIDDTRAVTPLKLAAAIANFITGISSSDVTTALGYTPCKKITAQNGALTASSGVCTWTITNSIGSADVLVQVRNASTGAVVEVAETITASTITIKLNSTSNIAANTYKAVIIG